MKYKSTLLQVNIHFFKIQLNFCLIVCQTFLLPSTEPREHQGPNQQIPRPRYTLPLLSPLRTVLRDEEIKRVRQGCPSAIIDLKQISKVSKSIISITIKFIFINNSQFTHQPQTHKCVTFSYIYSLPQTTKRKT